MTITTTRRAFGGSAVASLLLLENFSASARPLDGKRFGQVNRLRAKTGRGDALREELRLMVTALSTASRYDVLRDDRVPDTFWTVELWPTRAAHDRAVLAPAIQAGIERCRLMVAEFENVATFDVQAAGPPEL